MRASALKYKVLSVVSVMVMLVIFLMPFHAFLTIWASDTFGHYTALRLWKEALLVIAGIGALFLIFTDKKIRTHTLGRRLVWLIIFYMAINVLWGAVAFYSDSVSAKAIGYGLIVNLRFLIFFLLCWALVLRLSRLRSNWQWLLLWPAAIVVVFGLLQVFVLPKDFLSFFGYSTMTIEPFETINNDNQFVRIASTLRGPNALGAYLLIPLSVLGILILKGKQNRKQLALFVGALAVLFFSFSRSAWIGAFLALAVIFLVKYPKIYAKRSFFLVSSGILAVAIFGFVILQDNTRFQNIVWHTNDNSTVQTSSNSVRADALADGADDLANEPLGEGPGTAGPASVYNDGKARIAENYYMQIAQETGWIGLIAFLLINVGVGYLLWLRRTDTLALGLLASLIGISFINLLSHAWTDDTIAYIWWGLAGIAMIKSKKTDE